MKSIISLNSFCQICVPVYCSCTSENGNENKDKSQKFTTLHTFLDTGVPSFRVPLQLLGEFPFSPFTLDGDKVAELLNFFTAGELLGFLKLEREQLFSASFFF